jgi:hypothetical protein
MSTYKIKLEDKAAFINRLDKQGIGVDSYEVVDNKLKGYFEFATIDPVTDNIVKTILKQSPKINKLKEMSKFTKHQLATIIREELTKMKDEKKKMKLKEYAADSQSIIDLGMWVKEHSQAVYNALGGSPEAVGNNIIPLAMAGVAGIGGALGMVVSKVKKAMAAKKAVGGMMQEGEDQELVDIMSKIDLGAHKG